MMGINQSTLQAVLQVTGILLGLCAVTVHADMIELGAGNNNFTMLDSAGERVGGSNDIVVMWDGTFNTSVDTAVVNMTISSATPFFGIPWYAHDIKVFGPGSYTFEACPGPIDPVTKKAADGSQCNSGVSTPLTMVVGEGQVGAHMLFDWNNNLSIDVINVWDVDAVWGFGPNDGTTTSLLEGRGAGCLTFTEYADLNSPACLELFATQWLFASTDPDGDGIAGAPMVDGPFPGFNANFNIRPTPVPAALWLMASGLLGLITVARKKTLTGVR